MKAAPPVAVVRLAEQLGIDPGALRLYGKRAKTRTDHLRLVAQYLSWRLPTMMELKELDEFLLMPGSSWREVCAISALFLIVGHPYES